MSFVSSMKKLEIQYLFLTGLMVLMQQERTLHNLENW